MVAEEPVYLCVDAFGVVIPLEVRGQRLALAVRAAWNDALSDALPEARPVTVAIGRGTAEVHGSSVAEVLHRLSPVVTMRAIDQRAGRLIMMHAAVLADPMTGAAAVLVAPSGTGKTTAAVTLGADFVYLSDETAAIASDGSVLAYRKPLSIIETPGALLKKQLAASSLGMNVHGADCRVTAFLFIDRREDHSTTPEVTRLDVVRSIERAAPQVSYLPSLDRPLHQLAGVLKLARGLYDVRYREAASLGPVIRQVLGAS